MGRSGRKSFRRVVFVRADLFASLPPRRSIAPADWSNLETLVKGAVKEKQKFERVEMPKEALLEMFKVRRSSLFR